LLDTSRDQTARDTVREWRGDESRDNPREAALLAELLVAFFRRLPRATWADVAADVGVISAYRKQNNRLRAEIAAREPALAALPALRIDTVDRFQGGEREVLLVSLVNSNDGRAIGPLHADPRRLNVALSRAKTKLIIAGDRDTFTGAGRPEEEPAKEVYRRLFALLAAEAPAGAAPIVASGGCGPPRPPMRGGGTLI
jgi:superfamily I DNA and/or RNA helicase